MRPVELDSVDIIFAPLLAFEMQRLPELPRAPYDEPLDMVITQASG